MRAYGVKCADCQTIIYSRAGHDFRYCTCGNTYVDGGQGKFGGRWGFHRKPKRVAVDILIELPELREDWNHRRDLYGKIPKGTLDLRQRVVPDDEMGPSPD